MDVPQSPSHEHIPTILQPDGSYQELPRWPLLKRHELGDAPPADHTEHADVAEYLAPGEHIVVVREYDPVEFRPEHPLTAEEVIRRASRAPTLEEIGQHGPPLASVSVEEGEVSRYQYPHGRDGLETAMDVHELFPALLPATLKFLAETQGVENETYEPGTPYGQEQQGAIILVDREDPTDPTAIKFMRYKGWRSQFYGSADAPAEFIKGMLLQQSKDPEFVYRKRYVDKHGQEHPLVESLVRAGQWLIDRTNENPDGLIEYRNVVTDNGGLRNQGWRDSDDALAHADGSWARTAAGICALDVLVQSYDGMHRLGQFLQHVPRYEQMATELDTRAQNLQKVLLNKFVLTDTRGTYLASFSDRDDRGHLRLGTVVTSSIGRALASDILKSSDPKLRAQCDDLVEQLILRLTEPDMLTRWGVRTRSSEASCFRPFGYHGGTQWTHESFWSAFGMTNHGFYGVDRAVGAGPMRIHAYTGLHLEFIDGNSDEVPIIPNKDVYVYNEPENTLYLAMQRPPAGQAWAASKYLAAVQRYRTLPPNATDPRKVAFEKKVLARIQEYAA